MNPNSLQREALSVAEFCDRMGISRSTAYLVSSVKSIDANLVAHYTTGQVRVQIQG